MLSPRTEKDYREAVARWERHGSLDPVEWVAQQPSEARRRNTRAALIWHHRVEPASHAVIPCERPSVQTAPEAFTVDELAVLREMALGVQRRTRPTIDLLYSTGARLTEGSASGWRM